MGNAKERFRQWLAKGRLYPLYGLSLEEAACAIWQDAEIEHARIAKQREAELVEAARALSTAVENIDGDLGGVDLVSVYAKADHLDAILAKHKAEGREGS